MLYEVITGYRVMKKNGPRGVSEADVAEMKYLILSANMVAADAAAAKIFGIEPADVQYIVLAEQAGLGTAKLDTRITSYNVCYTKLLRIVL